MSERPGHYETMTASIALMHANAYRAAAERMRDRNPNKIARFLSTRYTVAHATAAAL